MPSFTFLHAADLHLDSPLRGLDPEAPPRIRDATRQALIRLVDTALERRVDFVLLAGDLYDGAQRDFRCGQFLLQQLGRLTRGKIEIVAIRGNHDADSVLSQTLTVPGMMGSAQAETRLLHVPAAVHGQSFATKAVTDNLAAAYPEPVEGRFNIGLLHTACGQGGHENYAPCTPDDLTRRGYDYWALGHVHTRTIVSRTPWIVFPGNIQGRHVNEDGAKGATLVTVTDGAVTGVEPVALDVLRWHRLEVNVHGAARLDDVMGRAAAALGELTLQAEGRMLAVRLYLTGECPAHLDLAKDPAFILQEVRGMAAGVAGVDELWIEAVRLETAPPQAAALRDQPGAVGALIAALEAPVELDPDLIAFVKDQLKQAGDALDPNHPAHAIAGGALPPELVARARARVLAELTK